MTEAASKALAEQIKVAMRSSLMSTKVEEKMSALLDQMVSLSAEPVAVELQQDALSKLQRYATRHDWPFMGESDVGAWVLYDEVVRAVSPEKAGFESDEINTRLNALYAAAQPTAKRVTE